MFLKQKIRDLKNGDKTNAGKLLKEMDLSADTGKNLPADTGKNCKKS